MLRYLLPALAILLAWAPQPSRAQPYVFQGELATSGVPAGLGVAPDGTIAVLNNTSSVPFYDAAGNVVKTLTLTDSTGTGYPLGMAYDASGDIIATVLYNQPGSGEVFEYLYKYDSMGTIISSILLYSDISGFSTPIGPIIAPNGSIIVLDPPSSSQSIRVFDANFNLLSTAKLTTEVNDAVSLSDGTLLVTVTNSNNTSGTVETMDYGGTIQGTFVADAAGPIAIDPARDRIFVVNDYADTNGLTVYDASGTKVATISYPGSLDAHVTGSGALAIAASAAGQFYVVSDYGAEDLTLDSVVLQFGYGTAPAVPVAVNDTATVAANTETTLTPTKNDQNGPFDALTITSAPSLGSAYVLTPNTVTYQSKASTSGAVTTDSFSYTVSNTSGTSAPATVTVTILPQPPTPNADVATTVVNTPVTIDVTANDTLGPFTGIAIASQPADGTVSVSGLDAVYTPAAGFYGTDSFTYTVSNAGGTSSTTATVTVIVSQVAPVAAADMATTPDDTPVTIAVTANDSNGPFESVAVGTQPANGTATVSGLNIVYTPTAGFYGTDSFTYFVTNTGGTASATVTVAVTLAPPTVAAVSASTKFETAVAIPLVPTGVYTGVAVTQPAEGAVTTSGTTATYTPAAGFYGTDHFTYTASNAAGTSSPATVTVTVAVPSGLPKASWTQLGDQPGNSAAAIAFDAASPSTLLMGGDRRTIYRRSGSSPDWTLADIPAATGSDFETFHSIIFLPQGGVLALSADDTLGTYGGLYKSTGIGTSFARVAAYPDPNSVRATDGPTGVSGRALAATPAGGTIYAADRYVGIQRSLNGGVTWKQVYQTAASDVTAAFAVAIDPATPTTVYAGIDGQILKSTNTGTSWTAIATPGSRTKGTDAYVALAVNPATPATVAAADARTDGTSRVFVSHDSGAAWTEFTGLAAAFQPTSLAWNKNGETLFVAGEDANRKRALYKGKATGGALTPIVSALDDIAQIVVRPGQGGNAATLFGVGPGGFEHVAVPDATDGIAGTLPSPGISPVNPASAIVRNPTSGVLFAGGPDGLAHSKDGGETWQALPGRPAGGVYSLAIDLLKPAKPVYAAGVGKLFVWRNGAAEALTTPLTGSDATLTVAVDPAAAGRLYITDRKSAAYRSDDAGAHWVAIAAVPSGDSFAAADPSAPILANPGRAGEIYVGVQNEAGTLTLRRSLNAGASFTTILDGAGTAYTLLGSGSTQAVVATVPGTSSCAIELSSNDGTSWSTLSQAGIYPACDRTSLLAADPAGTVLYAVAANPNDAGTLDLFASSTKGNAWSAIGNGTIVANLAASLSITAPQTDVLFLATGSGLYKASVTP